MSKYKHNEKPEEEYIDLVPILQNLYFDVDKFLNPIKSVEVANSWCEAGCRCGRYDCKWLSSDRKLTETGSAKFFVKDNGDTLVQNRGILNDREIRKIQEFIKQNYQEMYLKWSEYSREGFYEKNIC